MGKFLGDVSQVPIEAFEPTARIPFVLDLAPRIGKHRTEVGLDRDLVTEVSG
jgi:hypothetical protein